MKVKAYSSLGEEYDGDNDEAFHILRKQLVKETQFIIENIN